MTPGRGGTVWPPGVSADDISSSELWDNLDLKLPRVNHEALEAALSGFKYPLADGISMSWLALAVRRAVASTLVDPEDAPEAVPSNAAMKHKLQKLADRARDLYVDLERLDRHSDSALYDFLNSQGEDFDLFVQKKRDLDALHSILAQTATAVAGGPKNQAPRWRDTERREARVLRVRYLAPIFEMAFQIKATADDFRSGKAKEAPPFMSFYQLVVALSLGEKATPDLKAVAGEGLALHRESPVRLPRGLIPGFPHLSEHDQG